MKMLDDKNCRFKKKECCCNGFKSNNNNKIDENYTIWKRGCKRVLFAFAKRAHNLSFHQGETATGIDCLFSHHFTPIKNQKQSQGKWEKHKQQQTVKIGGDFQYKNQNTNKKQKEEGKLPHTDPERPT